MKVRERTSCFSLLYLLLYSSCAWLCLSIGMVVFAADEEEMSILSLYYAPDELVVSPTRAEKPIRQVAENVTVISAQQISEMNAHTLSDVLRSVPGFQVDIKGGPGIVAHPQIQGSDIRQVLVLVDGLAFNNLSDSVADISAIPLQHVERIEIIKGPASSAWGSALGGVVNIVTKSPTDKLHLEVVSSYGEGDTGHARVESSGKAGGFGYYVAAESLYTDGLRPRNRVSKNDVYLKLSYEFMPDVESYLTVAYDEGDRSFGEFPSFGVSFDTPFEYLYGTFGVRAGLPGDTELDLFYRTSKQDFDLVTLTLDEEELGRNFSNDERTEFGATETIETQWQTTVVGWEIKRGRHKSNSIKGGEQVIDSWDVFSNDTISMGRYSVTPGIRYDYTSTNGEFWSPSLGVTFSPDRKTVFRAAVARGFNIPPLAATFGTTTFFEPNPELRVEKVWSYQLGVETTAVRHVWAKATVFLHDVRDAIEHKTLSASSFTTVNRGKVRRQGVEVEFATLPVFKTWLETGFMFVDAEDRITGEPIRNTAEYTWDIALRYKSDGLRSALKGHYVWWNAEKALGGTYDDFVWDMDLTRTFYSIQNMSCEGFIVAHNIFNGAQYLEGSLKNPDRWIEAGLRFAY